MTESLNELIAALRDELQHYGEMLARLDHQQDLILRRASDDVAQSTTEVNEQSALMRLARRHREQTQRRFALRLELSEDAAIADFLPRVPADYRPLLRALVEENNELIGRIHQRARQNHLLLHRSLELMQNLLSAFFPGCGPGGYDGSGNALGRGLAAPMLCEAVC